MQRCLWAVNPNLSHNINANRNPNSRFHNGSMPQLCRDLCSVSEDTSIACEYRVSILPDTARIGRCSIPDTSIVQTLTVTDCCYIQIQITDKLIIIEVLLKQKITFRKAPVNSKTYSFPYQPTACHNAAML